MRASPALLVCLTLAAASDPGVQVPREARQGDTIRIATSDERFARGKVYWQGKAIPLFRQADQWWFALAGVPATLTPGEYKLTIKSADGLLEHSASVLVQDSQFPIQDIQVSKRTKALRPMPGEMRAITALKATITPVRRWREPFVSPVPDCMNSVFGVARHHNGKPTGNYHKGVDLRSPRGRPIRAIADGRIVLSRMFRLHGGTVGIDHGQGLTSLYIHLSRLARRAGAAVKQGDVIGHVGSTGFATGPHLHWQLFVHGTPVNPEQWIPGVEHCE